MEPTILIVDDSKTIRALVARVFKPLGYGVVEASGGAEGLALAGDPKPDAVLLDWIMPGMSGHETLEKFKSANELRSIPVIVLTAEVGRETLTKISRLGADDHVVKPFKEEWIAERVGRVVRPRGSCAFFARREGSLVVSVPGEFNQSVTNEIAFHFSSEIAGAVGTGIDKVVLDFSRLNQADESLVRFGAITMDLCQASSLKCRLIGSETIAHEFKRHEAARDWQFVATLAEAASSTGGGLPAAA